MSVSAINGISKHTKFVIPLQKLYCRQTNLEENRRLHHKVWRGEKKENSLWLKFFKCNHAVQLCDLRPICWLPAVPFSCSLGLSLLFSGPTRGGSGGTSYPGPGIGGPGRAQVSALSFGVAPSGVCMGLNFSEDLLCFLLFT